MTTPTFTYDPDEEDNRWGPGVAWTHPCTGACGGVSMQHIPVDRPSRWDTLGRSDAPDNGPRFPLSPHHATNYYDPVEQAT